jgi:hypothetical protein
MTELMKTNEEKYPSVDLAYTLALASYELIQKRLDVIDTRLQTLIALIATVSLPIPAIAVAKNLTLNSEWFIAAVVAFVAAIVVGTIGRVTGHVKVILPITLYNEWLHFSEWEFKKNMIFFAGKHFEHNRALANRRGWITSVTALLFFIEGVLVALWVTLARS